LNGKDITPSNGIGCKVVNGLLLITKGKLENVVLESEEAK
jgi:hypothetical protein